MKFATIFCQIFLTLLFMSTILTAQEVIPRSGFLSRNFRPDFIIGGDEYLYTTNIWSAFEIIDISEPTDPVITSYLELPSAQIARDLIDNILYTGVDAAARNHHAVYIMDVSNPEIPTILDTIPELHVSHCMKHFGDIAIWGRYMVDVSQPDAPAILGYCPRIPTIRDVAVYGEIFIYTCERYGIKIVSWADPENPDIISSYHSDHHAISIEVVDDFAYVTMDSLGIQVFDLTDPANLRLIETIEDTLLIDSDLELSGHGLYYSSYGRLGLLDVSDPATPRLINLQDSSMRVTSIERRGSLIYSLFDRRLSVIDVSNDEEFTELLHWTSPYTFSNSYLAEEMAYIAAYRRDENNQGVPGLYLVDISNLSLPQEAGFFCDSSSFYNVRLSGDHMFTYDNEQGLRIYDLAEAANPVLLGNLPLDVVNGIYVSDDLVICRGTRNDTHVLDLVDIQEITQPQHLSSIEGAFLDYETVPGAIIALNDDGVVQIYDIVDRAEPELIDQFESNRNRIRMYLDEDRGFVYQGEDEGYLAILDLEDPFDMRVTMECSIGVHIGNIKVMDDICFISNSNGLYTFDVSDSVHAENPRLTDFGQMPQNMILDYPHLYLQNRFGFSILDISNPEMPREIATGTTPTRVNSLAVKNGLIMAVTTEANEFFDCREVLGVEPASDVEPNQFGLLKSYPNPFNSSTRLEYELPTVSMVKINLYDLNGHLVESLVNSQQTAGVHSTVIKGDALPSGLYVVRVEASGVVLAGKVLLLK